MSKSKFSIANVSMSKDSKNYVLTIKLGLKEYALFRTIKQFNADLRGSSVSNDMIAFLKGVSGEANLVEHKAGDPWIGVDKDGNKTGETGIRKSDGVTIPHDGGFVTIDLTSNINLVAAAMIASRNDAPTVSATPVAKAEIMPEPAV